MSMNQPPLSSFEIIKLRRPISVAIYDDYHDAAHAVDYLSDRQFPVENLAIVGTDLKSVEKVTGNVTWGKVLAAGFLQGFMWAGMFAIIMWLVVPGMSLLNALVFGILGFGLVGMVMAAIQYRMRGGERDYTSTTQIIATHYEVLAEAEFADRARSLLSGGAAVPTREVSADLGSMPPPFGQRPSAEQPEPQQPGPQQPLPQQPVPQPVPQQPGPEQQPWGWGQPGRAEQTPYGPPAGQPYGQYWGSEEPPGIGDVPSGFRPAEQPEAEQRPRRSDPED